MKAVGIICEYNPFHTGHAWQLAELRRRFGTDAAVVCAMSGNFVQRGDFAIVRKHVRAEAAIRGGADLALELPLPWAISSAEKFACGGVEVLAASNVVGILAFGSECANTGALVSTAKTLIDPTFASVLREELKRGDSFAAARARASAKINPKSAENLRLPNDILGVEYCKSLLRLDGKIEPLALPRRGAAHDGGAACGFASASHIRGLLAAGERAEAFLTPEMARLYEAERVAGRAPVRMEALERGVLSRLRAMDEAEFAAYDAGNEGLYHRFYAASREAVSVGALLDAVKTKRYAYARLRRMLLAMLLGLKPGDAPEHVPYLRVLAMNDRGKALLREMREAAALPVLTKPAGVRELSDDAARLFEWEARATDLYALAYPDLARSRGGSEWTTGPVIVGD